MFCVVYGIFINELEMERKVNELLFAGWRRGLLKHRVGGFTAVSSAVDRRGGLLDTRKKKIIAIE